MSSTATSRRSKKKIVDTEVPAPVISSLTPESVLPPLNPPEPPKKSRKKQFSVVASVGPNGIQGNLLPEIRKPLIAHLPIQSKDIQFGCLAGSATEYDPNPPPIIQPFDSEEFNSFSDIQAKWNDEQTPKESTHQDSLIQKPSVNIQLKSQELIQTKKTETQLSENKMDYYKKELTLLVQFEGSKDTKTLPETSDAACFWCCHTFTNKPCVLPQRDLGTHLLVSGNFCSPECAMAYLFDTRVDSHSRWEQMSLLHRIYADAVGGRIYPAPSKKILKMFGGIFEIEQYRDNLKSHKYRVDIHIPPMVSILATMDTKPIDFYDASLIKTILETAQERVAKAEEVLRLKRSKPLKAWESTLDACINLRVTKAVPIST
jgi:hypothetical protein